MKLRYPVELTRDIEIGGFTTQVKDIPSAYSEGDCREEALTMTLSVLLDVLRFNYFERNCPVPIPFFDDDSDEYSDYVEIPEDISAKIHTFNARFESIAL
ncbi:hypothetical protein AGMMS50276_25170 [Synergistales bacterium]|nr:hypothetical protein AGMMS50276_25170 [Synergistales bacterium]